MTAIRRTAVVVRGLLAAALLLVLVVGVPAALLATVGNPIPDRWTWGAPLTNEALLGILACVAWVFWAQLLVCVIVETTAEIRLATGRSADWLARVPGTFGGQQALARTLVQAVVTIGVTTTAATAAATTWTAHADAAAVSMAPAVTPSPPVVSDFASAEPVAKPQRQAAIEVDVVRGDTLWSIAEQHLGAGERWREIADLNRARPMADGATFDDARTIQPGWSLLVPSTASAPVGRHLVTVERGDTLWEIAEEKYGDGAEWPRIYEANEAKIEDPHWIYPGQALRVPGRGRVAPTTPEEDPPLDPPVHAYEPAGSDSAAVGGADRICPAEPGPRGATPGAGEGRRAECRSSR